MPRHTENNPATDATKLRTTSRLVASAPGCLPLKEAYAHAEACTPKSWGEVQDIFLRGMEAFDENISKGIANIGDLQNGKGDFFNDLLALLLENCAGVQLYSRGDVPGLIFPKHSLDVTYPSRGLVEFVLEAKAVGTPKHPLSPRARQIGRAGSADLDKRVKEIAFKTIDLKAEHSRILTSAGASPTPISGDLTNWLRSVRPRSYVFFAARVISDKDARRVISLADVANQVSDAVGVFCFRPVSPNAPTTYRAEGVPPHISLDRVLFRACQDLTALKGRPPITVNEARPARKAEEIPAEEEK